MKIMHCVPGIPPVRGGGMIKYALDIVIGQKKQGDCPILLVPGVIAWNSKKRNEVRIELARKWNNIIKYEIINPLPVPMSNGILDIDWYMSKCDIRVYTDFLKKISPDLIHIHSLMGIHKELLEAATYLRIPIVYTTHDYFGICLKADLMVGEEACRFPGKDCEFCSRNAFDKKRLWLEQSRIYRLYRSSRVLIKLAEGSSKLKIAGNLRSTAIKQNNHVEDIICLNQSNYKRLLKYYTEMFKYIDYYHFNSNIAKNIFEKHLGTLNGQVINISNHDVQDRRHKKKTEKKLIIGFLGGSSLHKGLKRLTKIMSEMYNDGLHDMELHVYDSQVTNSEPFVKFNKAFNSKEKEAVYSKLDILIVPSIWNETFGMVVVEALSYGVPVILTENVGAKDILQKTEKQVGLVVPNTEVALREAMEDIYFNRRILEQMKQNIQDMDMDLILFEKHLEALKQMYWQVLNT